jgi:hypothetical protein
MFKTMGEFWCKLLHDRPNWPIHGRYACRVCGRSYAVPWEFTTLSPDFQRAGQPGVTTPTLAGRESDFAATPRY